MQHKEASLGYYYDRAIGPDGIPLHLYKFFSIRTRNKGRSYNEFLLSIIDEHYLWHADPNTFNDPFDCYTPLIDYNKPTDNYIKQFVEEVMPGDRRARRQETNRIIKNPSKLINSLKATTPVWKVCSFAKEQISNTMWAHYADCHTGLCLKFDNMLLAKDNIYPYRITYENDFKPINFYERPHEAITNMITTKSVEWSYEKEYRSFEESDVNNKVPFNKSCVVGVTFGCKTSKEDIDFIMNCFDKAGYINIEWGQAHMQQTSFDLLIKPFHS
jgi:hypothetical protein